MATVAVPKNLNSTITIQNNLHKTAKYTLCFALHVRTNINEIQKPSKKLTTELQKYCNKLKT